VAQRLARAARAGEQNFALRRGEERFLRPRLGDERNFAIRVRRIGLDERNVLVVSQLEMMGTNSHFRVLDFLPFLFFQGRVRFQSVRIAKDPMTFRASSPALGMTP